MNKLIALRLVIICLGVPAILIQGKAILNGEWYGAVLMIMTIPGLLISLIKFVKDFK